MAKYTRAAVRRNDLGVRGSRVYDDCPECTRGDLVGCHRHVALLEIGRSQHLAFLGIRNRRSSSLVEHVIPSDSLILSCDVRHSRRLDLCVFLCSPLVLGKEPQVAQWLGQDCGRSSTGELCVLPVDGFSRLLPAGESLLRIVLSGEGAATERTAILLLHGHEDGRLFCLGLALQLS